MKYWNRLHKATMAPPTSEVLKNKSDKHASEIADLALGKGSTLGIPMITINPVLQAVIFVCISDSVDYVPYGTQT